MLEKVWRKGNASVLLVGMQIGTSNIDNTRKVWPWNTKWIRAKANRVLPREHSDHSEHLFQQHKRQHYTWTSPDGQYWNQIDYIFCSQRWRNSTKSAKTRLWADCGSDHELLIAKFRFKLRKVGKTTRPFEYDLNLIPYDYTVEVTNKFKGLDLVDRVPEELWMEVCNIVQDAWPKSSQRKRNARR